MSLTLDDRETAVLRQALDNYLPQHRDLEHKEHLMKPTSIQRGESDLYTKLSRLSGKEFDESFTQHMVNGHKDAISLFENEEKSGQNPDLCKYAHDQLPVLKQH